MELLEDFPHGPLESYRKRASFDWKRMKVLLETEDVIRYKKSLLDVLKSDTLFDPHSDSGRLSFDERRRIAMLRMRALGSSPEYAIEHFIANFSNVAGYFEILFSWDPSVGVTSGLRLSLFSNVLKTLGTEQHADLAEASDNNEVLGCFTMTEIGHGSNTKMLQTRATYEPQSQTFLIHSPNFEAAKCWSGLLGQNATHTVLYAQLYTPDGVCHGLHQFVIQIRDVTTHMALPGVIIGDMGPKGGMNGIDNGILMFSNYRVPKSALLNRNVDVSKDGVYIPKMKDPKARFGSSLHALSVGRINITCICSTFISKAITIAIRYAAVRKQFGPENSNEEWPILEYQLHQYRLLPHLATAYLIKICSYFMVTDNVEATVEKYMQTEKPDIAERGIEMHAISSACKPFTAWVARDTIQECREACGGHGYLKASALTDLREDNDANITYEGENNVLIQQTSNWLLKYWPQVLARKSINTPYESINFLSNGLDLLSQKCQYNSLEEIIQPHNVLNMYQWMVTYLLKLSYERMQNNLAKGQTPFDAKNNNQVFYAKELSLVYIQHFILLRFNIVLQHAQDANIKAVLTKVAALFGLYYIEKQVGHLYQGGYFQNAEQRILLQDAILWLCGQLKDEAVALVDVIAPDDFLMNSVLGKSDGQVYQHLQRSIFTGEGNLSRVKWWNEVVNKPKGKL